MVKISNLPDGGDQESGDVLPGVRGGATRKVSGPLVQSDLAANGGSVPEVDQSNTFTVSQTIEATSSEGLSVTRADSQVRIAVSRTGSGASAGYIGAEGGNFRVWATDGDLAFGAGNTFAGEVNQTDQGLVWGAPTGGSKGPGTINAEALHDNGNRVLANGNTAGGDLPTSDPAVAGQLYADSADGYTVKVSQG